LIKSYVITYEFQRRTKQKYNFDLDKACLLFDVDREPFLVGFIIQSSKIIMTSKIHSFVSDADFALPVF
jgi:hypothetical protein